MSRATTQPGVAIMSRSRTSQQVAAMSRRTGPRAGHREQQQQAPAAAAIAGNHRFVSNPIFFREDGEARLDQPVVDLWLRRGAPYGHGLDAAAGVGKPPATLLLPLPPSRARMVSATASRGGGGDGCRPVIVGVSGTRGGGSGWAMRRVTHVDDDPFLAAYVACTKNAGGKKDDASANKQQRWKQQKRKKKVQTTETFGCGSGIWNGLAAPGAKYAGAMSCRHGSAVAVAVQRGRAPVAASDEPRGPTLDLSRPLVVCSRRWRELSLGDDDEHRAR